MDSAKNYLLSVRGGCLNAQISKPVFSKVFPLNSLVPIVMPSLILIGVPLGPIVGANTIVEQQIRLNKIANLAEKMILPGVNTEFVRHQILSLATE
jgi:hypothetical protein